MSVLCRVCLTSGVRMKILSKSDEKIYKDLAKTMQHTSFLPISLCYICHWLLLKYQGFLEMAQQSGIILTELLSKNDQVPTEKISTLYLNKSVNLNVWQCPPPIHINWGDNIIKVELTDGSSSYEDADDPILKETEDLNYLCKKEKLVDYDFTVNVEVKAFDLEMNENLQKDDENCNYNEMKSTKQDKLNIKNETHKDISSGEKPFQCILCGLGFSKKVMLVNHLKNHKRKSFKKKHLNSNKTTKSALTCIDCSKVFKDKSHLEEHRRFHTGERPFACNICDKRFSQKGHLKEHGEVHTREKAYSCGLCNKKFGFKSNLNVHMRRHSHQWAGFFCSYCGKKFDHKNSLTRHLRIHGNRSAQEIDTINGPTCEICEKLFPSQSKLDIHIATHSDDSLHACEFCSSKFIRKTLLERHHIRNHTEFKCRICGNTYKGDLKTHILTHTEKSLFKLPLKPRRIRVFETVFCDYCMKKFKGKRNLVTHITNLHPKQNNEMPFTCEQCEKTFRTLKLKQRHIFSYHTEKTETVLHIRTPIPELDKKFVCDRCPKRFVHSGGLKQHMVLHTGQKFPCTKCDRIFAQKSSLYDHNRRAHMKDKSYVCSQCGKRCAAACDLRTHVRVVHEGDKPFVCEICDKRCSMRSNLVRHMRTHTGEKPNACKLCDRRFADVTSLKKHQCRQSNDVASNVNVCF